MVQHKPVILCVDDEEIPLLLRKLVLQKWGYEVESATSAMQALELLSSRHFDLILSDQLMPGLSGTELARRAKIVHPEIPVILVSGVNEIPADAKYANLFVSKVEGPDHLCRQIAQVLSQSGGTAAVETPQ